MESIRAWLQDRKNLPIVAAGTAIIVIVVILVFLRQTGTIGGGRQAVTPSQPQAEYLPTPEMPQPTVPGVPGAPVAPSSEFGELPGAMPTDTTGQVVATAQVQPPMLPYRRDPFQPFAGPPTRASLLSSLVPSVASRRLAPPSRIERPDMPEVLPDILPPQPFRRMVGVMHNGQVSAILETDGVSEIVRPGMRVPARAPTVLVESIEADAIILKTLDTPRPMTIRVGMAGAITQEGYDVGTPDYGVPGLGPPGYGVPPAGPGVGGMPMGVINP